MGDLFWYAGEDEQNLYRTVARPSLHLHPTLGERRQDERCPVVLTLLLVSADKVSVALWSSPRPESDI